MRQRLAVGRSSWSAILAFTVLVLAGRVPVAVANPVGGWSSASAIAPYDHDAAVDVAPGSAVESVVLVASVGQLGSGVVPVARSTGPLYDPARSLVAPRTTFSNLDPSDVPRVNGFQAINPNSLSNASGRFNYTVLDDGSLVVANRRYGHIDLANGGDVLAAGEVHIVSGQIRSINNASGHYRPSGSSAQSAAENAFNALDLDVAPGAYREIGG